MIYKPAVTLNSLFSNCSQCEDMRRRVMSSSLLVLVRALAAAFLVLLCHINTEPATHLLQFIVERTKNGSTVNCIKAQLRKLAEMTRPSDYNQLLK